MSKIFQSQLSLLVATTLVGAVTLASCKSKSTDGTQVKTLDNVVANANGQATTLDVCGPDVSTSFVVSGKGMDAAQLDLAQRKVTALQGSIDSPDRTVTAAVLSGLAAAPTGFLNLLFNTLNARIVITNDSVADCTGVQADTMAVPEEGELIGNGTTLSSCWLPPSADHPQLRLILPVDAAKARANILQLAAFAYTEYVYKRASSLNVAPFNVEPLHTKLLNFAIDNAQLAAQFLTELGSSTAATGLATLNRTNPVAFGFVVYANTLDSYYCSASTRTAAASKFPQTMNLFHSLYVAPDLGEQ